MMQDNSQLLRTLLSHEEGPTLDFKSEAYTLRNPHEKGEYIKDILAMANTPRDAGSYIVMGVKKQQGLPPIVHGIQEHRDENVYQQLIISNIRPTPLVRYLPVDHGDKKIGILEILPERRGPFRATSDLGPVRRNALYWRAGSTNVEIIDAADEASLRDWHNSHGRFEPPHSDDWAKFSEESQLADNDRLLILVTGPLTQETLTEISGLAEAPWFAAFDFDPTSDEQGLLSQLRKRLQASRQIHEISLGENHSVNVGFSTYWYFARGLLSRAKTIFDDKYTAWLRAYGRDIHREMQLLAENTGIRPATFVLTCELADFAQRMSYFHKVIESALESFGERATFCVCTLSPAATAGFQSFDSRVATYALSPADIARGCAYSYRSDSTSTDLRAWEIPARGGVLVQVDPDKRPWLSEEMELIHQMVGVEDTTPTGSGDFLRGAQISWRQLAMHDDVRRDVTDKILRALRIDLGLTGQQSPGTLRYSLYHEPGAGGTTVARRLLWEMKGEVPAVVLRSCTAVETAERIRYVHKATALPVLVLVEGRDVPENDLDDLYTVLRSQQIPCVLIQVFRGFSTPTTNIRDRAVVRAHFLLSKLSNGEAPLFAERFTRAKPSKRAKLTQLARSIGSDRQAFFFGLYAFEEEFSGLPAFVRARIANLTPDQVKLVLFISLAYHYGHSSLPSQLFARMLGIPMTQKVDLERILPAQARDLLIREDIHWRPTHDLIAHEIIRQILNPASPDPRIWKQNLTHWAKTFAEFCRSALDTPSAEIVDIIHRCFVWREARSFVGREESRASGAYSKLLVDVPSQEDRLDILKSLTELFPDDAHIWAHLGRFMYREVKSTDAIVYINKGIELSPDDPLLYHMKGMALRSFAYDLLDEWKKSKKEETLSEAVRVITEAGEQFENSRRGGSQDEHGYVSHIQMLLRLLDAAQAVYGSGNGGIAQTVASRTSNVFLRDALDTAEGLLELVRLMQEGENESEYVLRCAADLDLLYGKHAAALQAWDSLLARQDVYKPSIRRQIVGTYLSRGGRRWGSIPQDSLRRSVQLLEQNLLEEPGEERNIRMWVQAVRRVMPPRAIDSIISRVAYWKANSTSVDAAYYLYVLYAILALDGSTVARGQAEDALLECKSRSRLRRNRSISFEWLGNGAGVQRLVHHSEMGAWDASREFWGGAERLCRIQGRVASIKGPEAGELEIQGGLSAFFVPGKADLAKGRDENVRVTLVLGFTYDGPRAWEVRRIGEKLG